MCKTETSVVIPVYNEEKYIEKCIKSLMKQDYPKEKTEWIFVDGGSTDKTVEILQKYADEKTADIRIYHNKDKTVPYAMNIGIKNAEGKYIVRMDAHAEYNSSYISKCIYYLESTDADNVGGIAETKARTPLGEIIAKMLSSKFGVGNSRFRTAAESGYVDTVPFGAFRKELFDKIGLYDTRLTRNQDNELNYRIRKNGGKIYLSSDIKFTYYCRDSVGSICDMARKNGKWNVITSYFVPNSMGVRHFVPLIFLLSVILLSLCGIFLQQAYVALGIEMAVYFAAAFFFSAKATSNPREIVLLPALFFLFHISYGYGSVMGVFSVLKLIIEGKIKKQK